MIASSATRRQGQLSAAEGSKALERLERGEDLKAEGAPGPAESGPARGAGVEQEGSG